MNNVYFITHPEVVIDPDIPVTEWCLSAKGLARMNTMLKQPWVDSIEGVFSSCEQKAIDGARVLSEHLDIDFATDEALGENDRSSTGYLPSTVFEATADRFFLNYNDSVDGWETAVNAQERIVKAIDSILSQTMVSGTIGIVSHGAVGTLLLCDLKGWRISREHDQPGGGGGNYFVFDRQTREVVHEWCPIDTIVA